MNFTFKRVGAGALATMMFATTFGVAGSGAVAQDQVGQVVPETVESEITVPQDPPQPQVRFVASEVVQDLPPEQDEAGLAVEAGSLRELVGTIDTEAALSSEMMCLAQAVYFEARGEPLDGQLAVARVVINRAESDLFPDDYCSVVTQRAQFSFVRGGRIPAPDRSSAAWTRAKAVARIAHRDLWDSAAGDSLYFHARYVSPSWARRMTARATIQNHVFYR